MDWAKAEQHAKDVQRMYLDLEFTPGVNTTFALEWVIRPLMRRYAAGERTQELYDAMMSLE